MLTIEKVAIANNVEKIGIFDSSHIDMECIMLSSISYTVPYRASCNRVCLRVDAGLQHESKVCSQLVDNNVTVIKVTTRISYALIGNNVGVGLRRIYPF